MRIKELVKKATIVFMAAAMLITGVMATRPVEAHADTIDSIYKMPDGHHVVNGLDVYSDSYCTAIVYNNNEGSIYIKDVSLWESGNKESKALTSIAGVPLKDIIRFDGDSKDSKAKSSGYVSSIKYTYERTSVGDDGKLIVTGKNALNSKTNADITTLDNAGNPRNITFLNSDGENHTLAINSTNPRIVRIDWNGCGSTALSKCVSYNLFGE